MKLNFETIGIEFEYYEIVDLVKELKELEPKSERLWQLKNILNELIEDKKVEYPFVKKKYRK